MRNRHVEWRVPYAQGVLEARGYKGGRLVLTQRRETTGEAARIVLSADRARLWADGEDALVITAEVQDARGRVVPTADNQVRFSLSGPGAVIGVGNGDPTSLEPDKGDVRRAFNGLCMAIVQAERRAAEIVLRASSPGLAEGVLRIPCRRARTRPTVL
jgi:beta-galactosidase